MGGRVGRGLIRPGLSATPVAPSLAFTVLATTLRRTQTTETDATDAFGRD